jgi:hypothetical protein
LTVIWFVLRGEMSETITNTTVDGNATAVTVATNETELAENVTVISTLITTLLPENITIEDSWLNETTANETTDEPPVWLRNISVFIDPSDYATLVSPWTQIALFTVIYVSAMVIVQKSLFGYSPVRLSQFVQTWICLTRRRQRLSAVMCIG